MVVSRCVIAFYALILSCSVAAQLSVQEVGFFGDASSASSYGKISIKRDLGGVYSVPEYKKSRAIQYPVAFVSGKKPLIKAIILADEECNARGQSIWVKAKFDAKFTTHIEFASIKGVVDNATGEFLYENSGAAVFSNLPFTDNKVVGLESATIMWYYQLVSEENGNQSAPVEKLWSNFEDTATPLYVTYDSPETLPPGAGGGRDYYHTLLARSCIPAHGRGNPSSIERGI